MTAYALRPAAAADFDFLQTLHHTTLRAAVEETWGWDAADQARRFRESFVPARLKIIVVEAADVGMLEKRDEPASLYVVNLLIAPPQQNRGLGTRILRNLLAEAAQRGAFVRLQVLKANVAARRLYERLGFRESGESVTHVLMRTG